MAVINPEIRNEDLSNEIDKKFDFSKSDNKNPDISREKLGYGLIKSDLSNTKKLGKDEKFSPEDIDHAFFQYAGKEIDKAGNSPQSKQLKELRTQMLIELQSIKDPREKLQKIATLNEGMIDTISKHKGGEFDDERKKNIPKDSVDKENDNFEQFKKLLSEISEKKQKDLERTARGFRKISDSEAKKSQNQAGEGIREWIF